MNFFGVNFFRTLIRARTGSFANVCGGATLENIKLGQIFGSWKNGSWALVDACNFFFDLLIRAWPGSFANVFRVANLEDIKLGQIFGSWKNGSWALVDVHNFFFWFMNWEHAQEALEMCQNSLLGFGLLLGSRSYYQMLPFLHNELFLGQFF